MIALYKIPTIIQDKVADTNNIMTCSRTQELVSKSHKTYLKLVHNASLPSIKKVRNKGTFKWVVGKYIVTQIRKTQIKCLDQTILLMGKVIGIAIQMNWIWVQMNGIWIQTNGIWFQINWIFVQMNWNLEKISHTT